MDAVERYRSASEASDIEALMAALSENAELVSPLSGRMVFAGDDLRLLLGAVYGSLRGLRWHQEVGQGELRVILGEARIAGLRLDDAMVLELDPEGRIRRIRPHLRPWLALTALAIRLLIELRSHPGLFWRALT